MKTSVTGAWLTVNRACNNRCGWCYAKSTGFNKDDMPFVLVKKLIFLLKEIEVKNVVIIGGEPTIYPYLLKIIDEMTTCSIDSYLITNGRKFANKTMARNIAESGIKRITFSAKGANPQHYKKLTGIDGYNEMIEGFHNLKDLGIKVPFSITIVNDLIPYLPELLENLLNEGVENISLDMASPVILKDEISADGIPDPRQLAEICVKIHNFLKGKCEKYGFKVSIPLCLLPEKEKEEMFAENRIATCCHVQRGNGLIFDQQGMVLPCNHFPLYHLGKFQIDFHDAKTFQKFWAGNDIQKFRRITQRYPTKECQECPDWNKCGGGCFVKWLYFDPKSYIERKRR